VPRAFGQKEEADPFVVGQAIGLQIAGATLAALDRIQRAAAVIWLQTLVSWLALEPGSL
jgi:hypothetical protein